MFFHWPPRVSADEFLAWHRRRNVRRELVAGRIETRPPKKARAAALEEWIRSGLTGLLEEIAYPGALMPPEMPVRIDDRTVLIPDIVVAATPADPEAIEVDDPVLVIHVAPSDGASAGARRHDYFRLPSMDDYLIVFPVGEIVQHDRRTARAVDLTGRIALSGIGIMLPTADFFPPLDP